VHPDAMCCCYVQISATCAHMHLKDNALHRAIHLKRSHIICIRRSCLHRRRRPDTNDKHVQRFDYKMFRHTNNAATESALFSDSEERRRDVARYRRRALRAEARVDAHQLTVYITHTHTQRSQPLTQLGKTSSLLSKCKRCRRETTGARLPAGHTSPLPLHHPLPTQTALRT
jgi:hypothetical protein